MNKHSDRFKNDWAAMEPIEPPGLLDQAIINQARRATAESTGRPRHRMLWRGGWATAVVAVLAFGLFLQSPSRSPQPLPTSPAADGVLRKSAPADTPAPAPHPAVASQMMESEQRSEIRSTKESFATEAADSPVLSPQQRLQQLSAQRESMSREEFMQLLEQFRREFPEYPVPEALYSTEPGPHKIPDPKQESGR